MGMTIDEIIQGIEVIKAQAEWDYPLDWQIVLDGAVDNMRKYQMFQAKHVERLKANMVAMLEDLDLQIDESAAYNLEVAKVQRLIRDRINVLRGEEV